MKQMSRRRAAPKPLQGPMSAKIAHVMSRGKEEGGSEAERKGAALLRRGQLQRPRKEVPCLSVCLSVCLFSPQQQQHQIDTPDSLLLERHDTRLSTPTFTSNLEANPNHHGHHPPETLAPEQSPRRKTGPTSRALQSLHNKYSHCRTRHLATEAAVPPTKE
jgi:hypothetical protein